MFKMGTEIFKIWSRPALEMTMLTKAKKNAHCRWENRGRIWEKYSLQQEIRPMQVFRQASRKMSPSRTMPALPNRSRVMAVRAAVPSASSP